MQLVACWPRLISSSTSPSGETTVTPPEMVVQTNARPSAADAIPSGTWPSESGHPLDAADRAGVVAAGDVAALGDVDRAGGAEQGAPRRTARECIRAERAVVPAAQLARVPVAEDDLAVRHDHGTLGKAQIGGEQR